MHYTHNLHATQIRGCLNFLHGPNMILKNHQVSEMIQSLSSSNQALGDSPVLGTTNNLRKARETCALPILSL